MAPQSFYDSFFILYQMNLFKLELYEIQTKFQSNILLTHCISSVIHLDQPNN